MWSDSFVCTSNESDVTGSAPSRNLAIDAPRGQIMPPIDLRNAASCSQRRCMWCVIAECGLVWPGLAWSGLAWPGAKGAVRCVALRCGGAFIHLLRREEPRPDWLTKALALVDVTVCV